MVAAGDTSGVTVISVSAVGMAVRGSSAEAASANGTRRSMIVMIIQVPAFRKNLMAPLP
jgi:flagellar basal body-associated protein FliL